MEPLLSVEPVLSRRGARQKMIALTEFSEEKMTDERLEEAS